MQNIKIKEATSADSTLLSELAFKIWPVAYQNIIGQAQIEYMLAEMYTIQALENQMLALGHRFLLAYLNTQPCGFVSFSEIKPQGWKIHKLYVLPEMHGKKIGKTLLQKAEDAIIRTGGTEIILNVNRNNPATEFYKTCGFNISESADLNFGPYVLNDYVMSKQL